ncbi:hypothetical protein OCH239_22245 [Roseivivax halodurans JCM 10272]|uniref:HTH cro/C1-type domain-containing protein n=1 Tax=Roseivivax halodurans JCM 10272 TaxID=1449350 RepID=X7E5H8_9RHOB|nr:helix-turn-helix domain-containing protein [Roseivivax halodurans]ETX10406.1 hypothetical protein OCH239_22245 [Roseivivax halodurans JCM 10272]
MTNLYHYADSGLPNVWLDGVESHETPYGPATTIPAMENLHSAIGMAIATSNHQMSGEEVRFLRIELDLSQARLAQLLDVTEQTVRRWEQGHTEIPGPAQRALAGFYVESTSEDGCLRDLMLKFAETDREMRAIELRFQRNGDDWTPNAA